MRVFNVGWTLLMFVAVGCADNAPARIDVAAPSITILDRTLNPLGARLLNAQGEVLPSPVLSYSATPVAVLSVAADGSVSCQASGDGTVIVAGGGQSASVTVSCRIITAIHAPPEARLVLGRAPERAQFQAVDERGQQVETDRIAISSSNSSVARYENGTLIPVGVGEAIVTARAGTAQSTMNVSVVELIQSRALALADGETLTWTLQQGSYELDLQVKATGSARVGDGVTVSWVGTNCPDAAEATQHSIKCTVTETASLTLRNPTMLGLGPVLNGFINLYRTGGSSELRTARAGS